MPNTRFFEVDVLAGLPSPEIIKTQLAQNYQEAELLKKLRRVSEQRQKQIASSVRQDARRGQ